MRAAATSAMLVIAACDFPASDVASPAHALELADLIGTWRWVLHTNADGTARVEDETWTLGPGPTPTELRGAYTRRVEVRSGDRRPFVCNQRDAYVQRAQFAITATVAPSGGFAITETGYETEPSPCDHGFRHAGAYTGRLTGGQLELRWDGGVQSLLLLDTATPLVTTEPAWRTPVLAGTWRWEATSFDASGYVQDEVETWQITARAEAQVDATYRRRVTVRSADGARIACANAPSWTFEDTYVLDARREEEHWHFYGGIL